MDRLAALEAFAAVVETGGFSPAARWLGRSTAAVSRQVGDLERRLGVRLLTRTTRRVQPTDPGLAYYERCRQILDELTDADALAASEAVEPSGRLRVSAPVSFAVHRLGTLVPDYQALHPRVEVHLDLTDRRVDLVAEGYDIAIRVGGVVDQSLLARGIGTSRLLLCAAPGYAAAHGLPATPAELADHECLLYTQGTEGRQQVWSLQRGGETARVRVQGGFAANNGDILQRAAMAGRGILMQPDFIARPAMARGDLVPVLPDWDAGPLAIQAVYTQRSHLSARIRTFLDFLDEYLATAG